MRESNKVYNNLIKIVTDRTGEHFHALSKVPRGSGNEDAAARFVVDFSEKLKDLGVTYKRQNDIVIGGKRINNVVLKKPATKGRRGCPPVVFQAHLDMVCQKGPNSSHDFMEDPIEIINDSEPGWIKANDTTLGADDGIGVAVILALFESTDIEHPPLEAVFTSDEEAAMSGAAEFDINLIDGRRFINIDAEQEKLFFFGCAGGKSSTVSIPFKMGETPTDASFYKLTISGLHGGHSGVEIGHHYANANRLLGETLKAMREALGDSLYLASVSGGTAQNAIPRQAEAIIAFASEKKAAVQEIAAKKQAEFINTVAYDEEQSICVELKDAPVCGVVDSVTCASVICALTEIPTGVKRWYADQPLVETSSNMGIVGLDGNVLEITGLTRSFKGDSLGEVIDEIKGIAEKIHANFKIKDSFPEWTPNFDSRLKSIFETVYLNTFGEEADTLSIHAGLECGYFAKKFKDAGIETDFLAIGPTILGAHTTEERLYWPSVSKIVELLINVLAEIDSLEHKPARHAASLNGKAAHTVHVNCRCMK